MSFFNNLKTYGKSSFYQNKVRTKGWFVLRWEVGLIVLFTLIAALMNIIPEWVGEGKTVHFTNGDRYSPNDLRDHLAYSTVSMGITIVVAIFIGVFTEIGQFAGKYSSALFALVPSLVWLMSDRSDNHISHIIETSQALGEFIFWSMVAIAITLLIALILKRVFVSLAKAEATKMKIEISFTILVRVIVVLVNILILLMLGYALVNYGIFTLHLADISPARQQEMINGGNPHPGAYDLHSEAFTTFIALVAVAFALLMVTIGLSNIFTSEKAVTTIDDSQAVSDSQTITLNQQIDLIDQQWEDSGPVQNMSLDNDKGGNHG